MRSMYVEEDETCFHLFEGRAGTGTAVLTFA